MAGVSTGTVDRVLHNRGEVKEETRKKIHKIIEELSYTPNIIAKSLASKKTYRIAVLLPGSQNGNPYWKKPLDGINKAAAEIKDFNAAVQVLTYNIDSEKEFKKTFDKVLKSNPDGVIFTPHFIEASQFYINQCQVLQIPVIFLDANLESEYVQGYFGQDGYMSGRLAAHLLSYSIPGNTTILVLNLTKNKATLSHLNKRERGFLDFISEYKKLDVSIISQSIDVDNKMEPEKTVTKILKDHPHISAVFVTNSRVHMVASILKKLKLNKLLLMGFDLVDDNLKYLEEGVIDFLICQKPEEQGYRSVSALFNLLFANRLVERVNYSPIDVIMKENIQFYKKYR